MNDTIDVVINGEARAVAPGVTLLELLADSRSTLGPWSSSTIATSCAAPPWEMCASLPATRSSWCIRRRRMKTETPSRHDATTPDTSLRSVGAPSVALDGRDRQVSDNEMMLRAIEASGAEIVTVAVRRVDLDRSKDASVLHHLDPKRFFLLANTAGATPRRTPCATRASRARPASTTS